MTESKIQLVMVAGDEAGAEDEMPSNRLRFGLLYHR